MPVVHQLHNSQRGGRDFRDAGEIVEVIGLYSAGARVRGMAECLVQYHFTINSYHHLASGEGLCLYAFAHDGVDAA